MTMDPSAQFALSVQSISKLKYTARQSPETGLKKTAQQFEALFLQNMLEAMRSAMPKSGLLHSNRSEMYTALMDRQWAQTLAERGIGLADMMVEQLDRVVPGDSSKAEDNAGARTLAGIPLADPRTLAPSKPLADIEAEPGQADTASVNAHPPLMAAQHGAEPLIALSGDAQPLIGRQIAAATSYARKLDLLPDHVSAFLDKMAPAARDASRASGIPERLILAQAALETGWGRHEITSDDGRPSYNAFNIKATGWAGDAARVATTEFANGRAHQTQAEFRVYQSYDHAFSDYVRLLTESPRYQPVLNAPTPEAAARQLQACGYATDPDYADKLISIMAQIPKSTAREADPLFDRQAAGALFGDSAGARSTAVAEERGADIGSGSTRLAEAYTAEAPLRRLF